MGFLEEFFEGVLEGFLEDFVDKILNILPFWQKPNKGEKKKDAKAKERQGQEQEPFGVKHVVIALGCVALMVALIHLLSYILIAIVMVLVMAVGKQYLDLFIAAGTNTTPADLKKELEKAKASGELSDILILKISRAMTSMQDGVEKQQVMSMFLELLSEMDPNMMKDLSKEEREELLQQLLGKQTLTESEVDRHSENKKFLDDNIKATAVNRPLLELESRETRSSCGEHEDVELRRSLKDKKKHKNPLKAMLRSVKRVKGNEESEGGRGGDISKNVE